VIIKSVIKSYILSKASESSVKKRIQGYLETQSTISFELMTPQEVQGILKCSLAYVYKLHERGKLPAVVFPNMGEGNEKPRSMIRFRRSDITNFINNHYAST